MLTFFFQLSNLTYSNYINLSDKANIDLQEIPDDKVLNDLPRQMGYCTVHLGIELTLTSQEIKKIQYESPKKMYEQTHAVLSSWKQSSKVKPTILRLMQAVERVKEGGLEYLLDVYKIQS